MGEDENVNATPDVPEKPPRKRRARAPQPSPGELESTPVEEAGAAGVEEGGEEGAGEQPSLLEAAREAEPAAAKEAPARPWEETRAKAKPEAPAQPGEAEAAAPSHPLRFERRVGKRRR